MSVAPFVFLALLASILSFKIEDKTFKQLSEQPLLSGSLGPNQNVIQKTLDGIFDQNNLTRSTTMIECIDQQTAKRIVVFISQQLQKIARGTVIDMIKSNEDLKNFYSNLPTQVTDCLCENEEVTALESKYFIDQTGWAQFEKRLYSYFLPHYLQIHGWFSQINTEWRSEKYYQAGYEGAAYVHRGANSIQQEIFS